MKFILLALSVICADEGDDNEGDEDDGDEDAED